MVNKLVKDKLKMNVGNRLVKDKLKVYRSNKLVKDKLKVDRDNKLVNDKLKVDRDNKLVNDKLKIAVDIDEVLVEFVKGFFNYLRLNGHDVVSYEDIYSYNLWVVLGLSKKLSIDLINEFISSKYFDEIDIVPFSREGIDFLKKNFDIYFISARPLSLMEKSIVFLREKFFIDEPKVFFSGEVYGSLKSKSDICIENGISYIIEDNLDYSVLYERKGINVFLLNKPWNINKKIKGNIIRFCDWKGLIKYLEEDFYEQRKKS